MWSSGAGRRQLLGAQWTQNEELDPDVGVRVDEAAARPGAPREIRGARNRAQEAIVVARQLARGIAPMGHWRSGTRLGGTRTCVTGASLLFRNGTIATVAMIGDQPRLREFDLAVLDG
jgi:hypothetical protein